MSKFKDFYIGNTFLSLDLFMDRIAQKGFKPDIVYERSIASIKFKPNNEPFEIVQDIISFATTNELTIVMEEEPCNLIKDFGFILNESNRDFRFPPTVWVKKYSEV